MAYLFVHGLPLHFAPRRVILLKRRRAQPQAIRRKVTDTQRENHLRVVSHHRFPSIDRKNRPALVAADDLGRQQRSR